MVFSLWHLHFKETAFKGMDKGMEVMRRVLA
jgi:hypothetical protein